MAIEFKRAPSGGTEQLEAHEAAAQQQIVEWWQAAERTPHYPCDTDTVIELLRAVQYDVNRTVLAGYVNNDIVPHPPAMAGQIEWNAIDIIHAQRALEARRRWQPSSLLHGHKFTMAEKMQHDAMAAGEESFAHDLGDFDIEGLLGMLIEQSSNPPIVTVIAEALRQKLKQAGVLT